MTDNIQQRNRWSEFFLVVCGIAGVVLLLLLIAIPFVFGFGSLTFASTWGENAVLAMKLIGFITVAVFLLSLQGYLLARKK